MLPGVKIRALLRPHGPDEPDPGNGQREPDHRHGFGERDSAHVSEQRPHGPDRGDQHSAGAAVRLRVLYLRGKSANLLSIGAVDFGIIVDSSVIMVENIYRTLSTGEYSELPLRQRVVRAASEVERSLFFSTLIMVCALLPLFTMQGPEGQLFGPMAETYAFALAGALLLAVTLSPVLCMTFLHNVRQTAGQHPGAGLEAQWPSDSSTFACAGG